MARALFSDPDALAFREMHQLDEDERSYGKIFEVRNWLSPRKSVHETGLSPSAVHFTRSPLPFSNFERSLINQETIASLRQSNSFNGVKMALVGLRPPLDVLEEGGIIHLEVAETDYYTIMGCLTKITNSRELRHRNMALKPEANRIPGTFGVQLIVRLADRQFLALHRSRDVAYDKDCVTFTAEEQLNTQDLEADYPAENLIIRAIMEEILPLRGFSLSSPQGTQVRSIVGPTRILSLALEEPFGNFSLVAFVQLTIDGRTYVDLYDRLKLISAARADREGRRYFVTEGDMVRFFDTGKCQIRSISDPNKMIVVGVDGVAGGDHTEVPAPVDCGTLYRMYLAGQLLGILRFRR